MSAPASLEVHDLTKHFPVHGGLLQWRQGAVKAVDGISFAIARGETLGLVGESGCGKTTVSRMVLKLIEPTAGRIVLGGVDVTDLSPAAMWQHRRHVQIVFQDPYSSLNPRLTAGMMVGEPLENFGIARGTEKEQRVAELFTRVGLRPETMSRYAHEFSGGQRQRLGIAKALAVNPAVIVADEPVSALDVSVRAQVLNLMMDLQEQFSLAYLFVSHDLAVVRHVSHRIAVMYLGRIVELADKRALFGSPLHPYTEALLAAAPAPDPSRRKAKRAVLQGDVPSPMHPPSGCRFHTRCPYATAECKVIDPPLLEVAPGRHVACLKRPVGGSGGPLVTPGIRPAAAATG
jgi:peptide/nickel transport system ATP-binding protein